MEFDPNQPQINPQTGKKEEPIRVDGFAQVLALLQAADPEFRDSLLRRIAQRDMTLARQLVAGLKKMS